MTHKDLVTRSEWLGRLFEPPAKRIVSLVPSLTEGIFLLGAGDRLVGRTEFCVRPKGKVESIPAVGGTKNINVEEIRALAPDVVLANKEENTKARVLALAEVFPVLLTDPSGPEDVPALWAELGSVAGAPDRARLLADEVLAALSEMQLDRLYSEETLRFVYFVWKNPWMVAGHDTYISNTLRAAGFENALPAEYRRFPRMTEEQLLAAPADVHFYGTEPFAFELPRDLLLLPGDVPEPLPDGCFRVGKNVRALLVDAEPLSWYPSQTAAGLRLAARLFRSLTWKS